MIAGRNEREERKSGFFSPAGLLSNPYSSDETGYDSAVRQVSYAVSVAINSPSVPDITRSIKCSRPAIAAVTLITTIITPVALVSSVAVIATVAFITPILTAATVALVTPVLTIASLLCGIRKISRQILRRILRIPRFGKRNDKKHRNREPCNCKKFLHFVTSFKMMKAFPNTEHSSYCRGKPIK